MLGKILLWLFVAWLVFTVFCVIYTIIKRQERGEYILTGRKRGEEEEEDTEQYLLLFFLANCKKEYS